MSLSSKEIGAVAARLDEEMRGGKVRKVLCPRAPGRIVLEVRTPGRNHYLQVVAAQPFSRIGRIGAKPERAEVPHPFVMLLRDRCVGAVLAGVGQIGSDRVLRLDFASGRGGGSLVCELTGRHANIFWVEEELIKGSLYPNRSHRRPLVPGQPYQPPAPHADERREKTRFVEGEDLEERIEEHYNELEDQDASKQDDAWTRRLARTAQKRIDRLWDNLEEDLARARQADELELQGHVLKAHLSTVQKGQTRLQTEDFEGRPIEVSLDPKRDAVGNMQRLYDKSKRLRRAIGRIEERQEAVLADKIWIEEILDAIESAETQTREKMREQIAERFPDLAERARAPRAEQSRRLPYREYPISSGRPARVGRSARDNDALTLHHAKPDDLWLHVRGAPGSHVVVPMGRGEEPSPDILIDAAHLAAHFSTLGSEDGVEVIYTRRRYVQKPKGAAPGAVRVLKEKNLSLRVERDRLERILGNQ